ncbi:MAG: Stp1/IreP family PP2C-type Ser/Thr phosphatase [Eubacteriales bacterium]|nr:Stp1/IreP family PP2C-type Ser/Thr phosphatase [Eubacteriales bacterium]
MKFYAKTHKGHIRRNNEDSFYAAPDGGFFAVVADGMGGHNAGDIASSIVVDTVVKSLRAVKPEDVTKETMLELLSSANKCVWDDAAKNAKRRGMGSTATVAVFHGDDALIGQVGDSRAYLFSGGVLSQITKDHSYVQMLIDTGYISHKEALLHPQRNIITRAVGIEPEVEADVYSVALKKEDCVLLCSDGLNAAVTDEDIADILNGEIESAADRLVDLALQRGGSDNISVIIACMDGERV